MGNYSNGVGGGVVHGGRVGTGLYHGRLSEGGTTYAKPSLSLFIYYRRPWCPCWWCFISTGPKLAQEMTMSLLQ